MTKKSKRTKSFFNENIWQERAMLDKKHIQFTSSRENPSFLFKAVNSILN